MEISQGNKEINNSNIITLDRKISLIILSFSCFFGYILNNHYRLILIVTVILSGVWLLRERVLVYRKSDFIFLSLILVLLFSAINSSNRTEALKYVFSLSQLFIIMVLLQSNTSWYHYFFKYSFLFSGLHVFFSVIYYVFPNMVNQIRMLILNNEALITTDRLFKNNLNAGISPQTGNNAYYIAVFIGIAFIQMLSYLSYKKNIQALLMVVVTVIGSSMLIATGKRGPLLAVILSLFLVMYINFSSSYFFRKNFFKLFLIAILAIAILVNTPVFQNLLNLIQLKQAGDLLSGRSDLWGISYQNFLNAPIFGVGLLSMRLILGLDTHNVYIQLLAETGLVGFLLFLFLIIFRLISTSRKILVDTENKNLQLSFFFQVFFICYCLTGNPIYNLNLFLFYIIFISIR